MRTDKYMLAVPLVAGMAAFAVPAAAQGIYGVEPQLSATEFMSVINDLGHAVPPAKFVSIQGIGSGTVAPGGMVFGSVSGTDRTQERGSGMDGSLSFGAGFGNADGGIGSQLTANITSAHLDDFGDSGYLSAKFGTRIMPGQGYTYAAVNFDGLAPWGDSADMDVRMTVAMTTFQEFAPFQNGAIYPLMLTAGMRTHGLDGADLAPIFGAGIGLNQYVSTSMSYNGDYVNAGFGVKLPGIKGAAAALTVSDVFDDEDRQRAVFAVSFATSSLFGRTQ